MTVALVFLAVWAVVFVCVCRDVSVPMWSHQPDRLTDA